MTTRNAERQASYRRRHADAGGGRINHAVEARAEAGLRRLAKHYGVTRRAMLERLIGEAEGVVIDALPDADRPGYYDG